MELNPDVQVTTVDVCSGALRKWRMEKKAEVTSTARYWRPPRSRIPRINPRNNVSSMIGTTVLAPSRAAIARPEKVTRTE